MSEPLDHASLTAIAAMLTDLLQQRTSQDALLTAGQVAERFNVARGWVYAHSHELGVVRIGQGEKPRLRFDPAVVAEKLTADAQAGEPAPPPARRFVRRTTDVPLLPIRGRTLDEHTKEGE